MVDELLRFELRNSCYDVLGALLHRMPRLAQCRKHRTIFKITQVDEGFRADDSVGFEPPATLKISDAR